MSDYIPTTADVRDAYSSESTDSKYSNRMFDLWLTKYKAKIVAKTEERIIKLLEDNQWRDEVVFKYAIALIKGENK